MMNFFITISCFAAGLPRMGRGGRTGRKTEFEFLLDLKKSIEMPVYGDRDFVRMGLGRAVTSKSDRNSIKLSAGSIERGSEACEQLFRRCTIPAGVVQSNPKPSLLPTTYTKHTILFAFVISCFASSPFLIFPSNSSSRVDPKSCVRKC